MKINFKIKIMLMILLGILLNKTYSQPGVPPAPYCMTPYFAIPCNQPNPPNTPGNFINDFIDSFNTTGGIVNIVNNNSTCNTQTLPGFGQVNYMYYGCQYYLQTVPGANIICNIRSGIIWAAGFGVWVDWNLNNNFTDPGELVAFTGVPPAYVFTSCNFNVPAGQPAGVYRLRVRSQWITPGNFQTPCGATTYGEGEDYNIYVSMSPPGLMTATVGVNSPICSGQSASLTVVGSYTGATTYTWTGPGAFTSTLQNPVIPNTTPTISGIYTVIVSPGACPITKTVQLYVNPTPTITASNNGPVCQGGTINLSTSAVPGGTLVNYNWVGPGAFTANVQNPIIANAQPSNSGVYQIIAVNNFSNGGICQSNNSTTVGIVPVNQTSVIPNFTLCQGSNLNLTALNVAPPTSYSWSGPSAFTSTLQNPSINNIMPINSGNYIITSSFAVPGITLVCTSTAISNVSVVATSPVTVTLPQNICQNTIANLTASTNPVALSYVWTGPNGFNAIGSTTTITNIQPQSTGLYNVVATWAIGNVSCTINGFNQINVVPVAPININAPISVCYPSNVALTANSPGAISYNWIASNGFTSNIANPLMSNPTATATGIYTVNTAYTNGALICFNSNTTQVTVNPILTFTLNPYKQVCFNSTYTVSGPVGANSYTWNSNNGFTSNNQVLFVPSIQSGGIYTLSVNLGPCTTSAITTVDVLSPINFISTPGNKIICKGDSIKLPIISNGGSGNYAYNWNPQIYLASPTGSMQTIYPLGTTIYNVTGYDITCPNYTISTSFTVNVNTAPIPTLNLEKIAGCEPLCQIYNSHTQNDALSITYDFGNGYLTQTDSMEYCLNNPGTYNLKIKTVGLNGCSETFLYGSKITVYPKANADFNWNPEIPNTTNNIVIFNPVSQNTLSVEYNWYFDGSIEPSKVKNPQMTYENGTYVITLVTKNEFGCLDTVTKSLIVDEDFNIFIPNTFTPNSDGLNDTFHISGLGFKQEGYTMSIFDRWGELLYTSKDVYKGWDGLNKGIYCKNDVYVYKIKLITNKGKTKEYIGHVTLLK